MIASAWVFRQLGYLAFLVLLTAPRQEAHPPAGSKSPDTPQWLVRIGSVVLGRTPAQTPNKLHIVRVTQDRIYALDGLAHVVNIYSRAGLWIASVGKNLASPSSLAVIGDTLLIASFSDPHEIAVFDKDGRSISLWPIDNNLAISALAASHNLLAVATVGGDKAATAEFVTLFNRQGRIIHRTCVKDPRYRASAVSGGMLVKFQFADVAFHGSRLLCVQPINTEVTVWDTSTNRTRTIQYQPTFYQSPRDTSTKGGGFADLKFLATWTGHTKIFPTAFGFITVYSRYDTTHDRFNYWIVACKADHLPPNCSESVVRGEPVAWSAPNLLYALDGNASASLVTLGIYRVSLP